MTDTMRLVIVEDDPLIAFDIRDIVSEFGHKVVDVFHSPDEFKQSNIIDFDLALLDINMGNGRDGIELGTYLHKKLKKPCIFITSYFDKETVHHAREADPLAYILKPYEEHDIIANLELSKNKIKPQISANNNTPIFVKHGGKLIKIVPKKVSVVQAYDMYTHLFIDGKRITASQTLKQVEKLFSNYNFIRVHKSFMVNMDAIDGICDDEILIGDQRVPVGRTYKKDLFDRILTM